MLYFCIIVGMVLAAIDTGNYQLFAWLFLLASISYLCGRSDEKDKNAKEEGK